MIIDKKQAIKLISKSNGKIFSVKFLKKDNSLRQMTCRLGVKKHLKGGELSFNPKEYDLIPVFDLEKNSYRMINLESLLELNIENQKYTVE